MNRIVVLAVLGVLSGMAPPALAETVYHWTDDQGNPVFSDRPPPPSVRQYEQRRVFSSRPEAVPAYSVRQVAASFPVTLYTAEECGAPCDEARRLLSGRGIPFEERIVTSEEDLEAFRALFGPPDEVPAATVGPRQLRGLETGAWSRLLDTVGYPREPLPPQ